MRANTTSVTLPTSLMSATASAVWRAASENSPRHAVNSARAMSAVPVPQRSPERRYAASDSVRSASASGSRRPTLSVICARISRAVPRTHGSGSVRSPSSAAGLAGELSGARDTDRRIYGIDVSGQHGAKLFWFGQILWNEWDDFLDSAPGRDFEWWGGFLGLDYIRNDRWAFSLLYNYNDAKDFKGTQTIFEGIEMNTLTLGASYYFMRNVKAVIELNVDFLSKDRDPDFVGHETREHYFLVGFDAAF